MRCSIPSASIVNSCDRPVRVDGVAGGIAAHDDITSAPSATSPSRAVFITESPSGQCTSPAAGGEAIFVPTDVTKREDVRRLVREGLERFGRIHFLLNSAGSALKR